MTQDETLLLSEIVSAARQRRAEALRRWMLALCGGLMSLFGVAEWNWRASKGD